MIPSLPDGPHFRRILIRTLLLPPLLVLALVAVLVWQMSRLMEAGGELQRTNARIVQIERVEKLFVDLETGLRGYLITSDRTFLAPYENGVASMESEFAKLGATLTSDASKREQVAEMKRRAEEWLVFSRTALNLKQTGADYQSFVSQASSKDILDQLRSSVDDFKKAEEELRDARIANAKRTARIVIGTSVATILILGSVLAFFMRRQLIQLSTAYGKIIDANQKQTGAMQVSEQRYRQLFESNPHPMWVYDLETLKFLSVNDAAIHSYGYSRAEFEAMTIKEIRPEEDVPVLLEHIPGRVENEPSSWKHRKKNGTLIDVEIASHSLEFDGRPAVLVLANDITEKKRTEEAVLRINEELERRVNQRTEQLAAANKELEAFSYSVSHDLRAPLRAMNGFSRIIQEDYAAGMTKEAHHYLNLIRNSATLMGKLIDDLLDFSRIGRKALQKRRVAPGDLVQQVLDELKNERKDRQLDISVRELPPIEADPALMKVLYTNLISNAIKYTKNKEHANIEVGCLTNGNGKEKVFYVKDNGAGFDMKYSDKLFGVFQRLHRADEFEGTGVGLATAQRIINRHGGRIWAEAETDVGATFYFTVPGETHD